MTNGAAKPVCASLTARREGSAEAAREGRGKGGWLRALQADEGGKGEGGVRVSRGGEIEDHRQRWMVVWGIGV